MQRRRVDFKKYAEDLDVVILALLGFSSDVIQQKTRLNPGQITYRLRAAGVKRAEYRNGKSPVAAELLKGTFLATIVKREANRRTADFKPTTRRVGIRD